MKMLRNTLLGFIFLFSLIILGGCNFGGANTNDSYSEDFFAMDTLISITLYDFPDSEEVLRKAKERLKSLENRMSVYVAESDVVKINKNAGIKPVKVHEETFTVIKKGVYYGELSDGRFDITTYPIIKLWDVNADIKKIPTQDEIMEKLPLIDYKAIRLDEVNQTVFLEKANMEIDLGGIAKGYIGDELVRLLKDHGVAHGVINLGGDVLVIGDRLDGTSWRIGVTDPRQDGSGQEYFAIVLAKDEAVITSGDYERYMRDVYKETGFRFHHIFDPKTGYPSKKGIISTTVISKHAIDGDAIATALFNMEAQTGIEFINELTGVEALIINDEKEVFMTKWMKDKVQLTSKEYNLAESTESLNRINE
jgi:FAD:protein FMN transferase